MFYNQPLATRFGTSLIGHITSGIWSTLDIAVAWVRESGLRHLRPALKSFLSNGNELNVVVGIDLENTTYEGLDGLLALEAFGKSSTFVHHNESGTIFHPKLYLLRNATKAKLIIGSNNITEAGLYRNTEAGLELEAAIGDATVISVINALDSWRDSSLGLARPLDAPLLKALRTNGYVNDEAAVVAKLKASLAHGPKIAAKGVKLFGTVSVTPPPSPPGSTPPKIAIGLGVTSPKKPRGAKAKPTTAISPVAGAGQVLLMRVRKARGTQVQIPLAVMRTPFFAGATTVVSVASSVTRGIHPTHASRAGPSANPNTLKLEMPETATMTDPFARFERTSSGIQYEVYDKKSAKGQTIFNALQAGRTSKPQLTFLTMPGSPDSATWWRFI